jgi:hypothetical protein
MTFPFNKLNISSETPIFSFPQNILSPLTSWAQAALSAISNIGFLFSQQSTFSMAQEAEIERMQQSLIDSPQKRALDALTTENTRLNAAVLEAPLHAESTLPFRKVSPRISFSDLTTYRPFEKDQSPSPTPLQPLPQAGPVKSILKKRPNLSEVD